jgi:hypothetical protein
MRNPFPFDGFVKAQISALTGSLIVEYDGAAVTREQIFAALMDLGYRNSEQEPLLSAGGRSTLLGGGHHCQDTRPHPPRERIFSCRCRRHQNRRYLRLG